MDCRAPAHRTVRIVEWVADRDNLGAVFGGGCDRPVVLRPREDDACSGDVQVVAQLTCCQPRVGRDGDAARCGRGQDEPDQLGVVVQRDDERGTVPKPQCGEAVDRALDLADELAVTPTARRSVRALEREPESIRVDSGVTLENLEQRRVDGPAQMPHSNCERISGPSSVTSTVFSARAPAGPPSPAYVPGSTQNTMPGSITVWSYETSRGFSFTLTPI